MSTTIHTYSATSLDWETAFSQDPSAHIQLPCTTTGLQAALTVLEADLSQLVVTSAGHADGRECGCECGCDRAHHTNGIHSPWS
ncbi:hypothetical protein [Luteococcus sp.]|uniref:hypothetical protein n=1 Tax=Luteococcus sp. TaxID=1969402 RepID=UPI003736CE38